MKLDIKWQVLIIVCIGIFMSTLDGSILNIANPTIAKDFTVSMKQVQWVVTAYMLVITASLLFFGRLGDRLGGHTIYSYGFLIFAVGSFLCSLASSLSFLVGARILQAVGASMMMATGIGIVSNTFPPGERGKALGLTASTVGIGNMTGPSLGGLLVAKFSWPVIFLLNVPIGLLAFFLSLKHLPAQPVISDDEGYDIPGTVLFALGAMILVISLSTGNNINLCLLATGTILLVMFYLFEKKSAHPMLDFGLFKIKIFLYGNIMGFLAYVSQTWIIFLMPFYLERMLNFTPAQSGLMMTVTPVCMAITAPLAGNLSDKIGPSRLTSIAFFLLTSAHLTFSTLGPNSNIYLIAAGLAVLGAGMGFFGSPNNSSILGSTPKEKAGYTGGFIATVRNFSFSLGIAASASIFSLLLAYNQQSMNYPLAYAATNRWVYTISASITLAGLLISLFTRQDRKQIPENSTL